MRSTYPETFASIPTWADEQGISRGEARRRFAQYAVLVGIASTGPLRDLLVFKGGNALDFVWQPNRSTIDLDFSVDLAGGIAPPDADALGRLLHQGMGAASRSTGVALTVQRVDRQPPGEGKTFVTFAIKVGYALPDETRNRERLRLGESVSPVIPMDISLNEPICATAHVPLNDERQLRVCTIDDIIAEKLRALLQQPIRNRTRCQDLLDIAVTLRGNAVLDRARVASFLLIKAQARDVLVSRAAFHEPEIARRARSGYAELEQTTRSVFVPFDDALGELYALIDELDIPVN